MAVPYTLNNTFRTYDQMMYNWLGGLLCDYGVTLAGQPRRSFGILRCWATPQRAFATMENLLVRKGLIELGTPPEDESTKAGNLLNGKIPSPFASITFGDPVPDPARSFPPAFWFLFSDDFQTYEKHYAPRPYNIPYSIDFWFKKVYTKQHILEWILPQFGMPGGALNEMFLTITFAAGQPGSGWGTKLIPITLDAIVDNSDLEPGEGDRNLRITATFTAKAWLFLPPVDLGGGETEGNTIAGVPLAFKYLDKCRYVCAGELYGEETIYDFELMDYMTFYLENTTGNAKLNYTDECTIDGKYELRFFPGDLTDYVRSSIIPVQQDDYTFKGKKRGKEDLIIEVWNEDLSTMIATQTFGESYPEFSEFSLDFTNPVDNGIVYIRIYSSDIVYMRNLSFKRITYNP